MEEIALNFIPLKEQEFTIPVYRKIRITDDVKNEDRAIFSLTLPTNKDQPELKQSYWLCFEERPNFTLYEYNSSMDLSLTNRFIFFELLIHSRVILKEGVDFKVYIKKANRSLKFILRSHLEGNEVISLIPYYLEYTKQYGFLIDYKFDSRLNQSFNRRIQQLSLSLDNEYKSNRNLYSNKFEKIKEFAKKYYKSVFSNTPYDFGAFCQLPVFSLTNRRYLFANNEEDNYPSTGLNKFGPYDKVNKPAIFYFYRSEEEKDKAFKLYNALIGKEFEDIKYYKGLAETYGVIIDQTNIRGINAEKHRSLISLEDVARSLRESHPDHKIIILAFSPFKEDKGDWKKRYLCIKYAFAQEQIPVQFSQYGTITSSFSLKSAIPNLALAVFAKLGGKPWKVKPTYDDCLIVGVSQTFHRRADKKIKKYVAYSVLLDTGGIYKSLEVLSAEEDFKAYIEKLKEQLYNVLKLSTNTYKKVALHITYRVRRIELEAINEVLQQFGDDIEFVVIRINTANNFWGYDQSKIHYTPTKNTYIPLSETKFLLWLEGVSSATDMPVKRYSGPIYVDFYYSNKILSQDNKQRYLQDLLNLSGANWRGLNAKAVPVSVYYCKLVSEYIKDFKEMLDLDDLQGKFQNPWFL